MSRRRYNSEISRLKHSRRVVMWFCFALMACSIGQALYQYYVAPPSKIVNHYQDEIVKRDHQIKNLEKKIKNQQDEIDSLTSDQ